MNKNNSGVDYGAAFKRLKNGLEMSERIWKDETTYPNPSERVIEAYSGLVSHVKVVLLEVEKEEAEALKNMPLHDALNWSEEDEKDDLPKELFQSPGIHNLGDN